MQQVRNLCGTAEHKSSQELCTYRRNFATNHMHLISHMKCAQIIHVRKILLLI
jgi:hypothetical protein